MGKNDTFLNHNMGDYRLQEILAVGGMSRVYLGLDQNLGRRAAVKVLELEQTWVDDTIIQRFEREARAIAALEHDNIITIYQYGKHPDGAYFLAMQYIDGRDLRVELKEYSRKSEKMPVERGIRIMQQVASALDFAHKADIIHRDIKPSNVLLTKGDKAILTDFGLVLTATDATLGTAFGTPRYIAPEQAVASQQAVPQSDIYSLAVIMYEILTGGTPFDGETPMEIALAHVSDTPDLPSKREKSVPEAVDKALMKALSKDPAERYQTSVEFVNAVAAGYGIGEQKASSATPVVKSSTSTTARAETSTPRGNVGVPSPVSNTASVPAVKDKRRSPVGVIIGIIVLVLAGAGGYFVLNGGGLPSGGGGSASSDDVVLHYDDKSVVIHNASAEDLSLTRVQFV
ncbi:MAG: protein kinase, partial [Chloroflexota bacterium]